MALAGGDVFVWVRDDPVLAHEHGEACPYGVHLAAEPDRLVIVYVHEHHLRRVERPAVIAGQPEVVGGTRDQQEINALLSHALLDALEAGVELGSIEELNLCRQMPRHMSLPVWVKLGGEFGCRSNE